MSISAPLQAAPPKARSSLTAPAGGILQCKLAIGERNDPLEHEAERIADQVLTGPAPASVSGAASRIHRYCGQPAGETAPGPASVDKVLADSGRPLEPALRQDMERRFGHDFALVRVHTGARAEQSAREINAHAYTVGQRIVFGDGKFAPASHAGRRLIAHELTHVVQQSGTERIPSGHGQSGASPTPVANKVQRFSDVDHHVIEEAALKALFSKEQLKAIETANMHRDYSQLPAAANALLLGQKTRFGGYAQHEHFDNFVFDRAADRWVSQDEFDKIWDDHTGKWIKRRLPVAAKPGKPRTTAPQYIEVQLLAAVRKDMPDASAFEHLGNAFHTIEDFFAHSNFVELMQGDRSHGDELATHSSHAGGPGSEESILATVSDQASAEYFGDRFRREQAAASPLSHGRLAKDFHGNPNHMLAITLAALVIRQVALAVKDIFLLKTRTQREKAVRETIVATLTRYFRPPSEKDKWWESLLSEDRGVMRRKIQALQSATPVTVNQTPASPLRNIEATRFSSMKAIGMGTSLSFSIGDRKFVTLGTMLNLPGAGDARLHRALQLPSELTNKDEKPSLIWGVQIGGSFEETQWFER
jgi:Domain of unknown function (DUF4157)/Heterokaryon incompatibility protein Het-C